MKGFKQLVVLAVVSVGFMNANAQSESRSFAQGNNIFTVGYGFPNLGKSILKVGADYTNSKVTGIGPAFVKYERAISDKVGLGISAGYVSFANEYTQDDSYSGNTYHYKDAVTRLGILARFNYHFANSEKFDPYFGFGAGYNNFKIKSTTDDPDGAGASFTVPINVAFEGSIGARYYFTKSIGAYAELGFGKSLIQAGLSAKF